MIKRPSLRQLYIFVFGLFLTFLAIFTVFSLSGNNTTKEIKADVAVVTHPIIVDHNSIDLFDQIPPEYYDAAKNLRMVFIDRSVGGNIDDGLDCLSTDMSNAPNRCKRWSSSRWPEFTSPAQNWSGSYDRSNWDYFFWPSVGDTDTSDNIDCSVSVGSWGGKADCFLDWANRNVSNYDVLSYQLSYLSVDNNSTIATPGLGYFDTKVGDLNAFEELNPDKVVVYWTTSLSRSLGNSVAEDFNNQMRAYAISNNKVLIDAADILSHDPYGNPCYDNRDGVTHDRNGNVIPDDGVDYPAICQYYTSEYDGGHLGSFSAGSIRMAKAVWVTMAQIAGWVPDSNQTYNTPPSVDAGTDFVMEPGVATLSGSVHDDGLPANILNTEWTLVTGPSVTIDDPTNVSTTVTLNEVGTYVFRLTADDSEMVASDDVSVEVVPVHSNVAPVASNQTFSTTVDTELPISLTFSDEDGVAPYTLTIVNEPLHGQLVGNDYSNLVYTPDVGYTGDDSFSWNISDADGAVSNTADVSITINPELGSGGSEVSYFKFDTSDLIDEISPCVNCVNNSVLPVSTGYIGGAYSFNGNDAYLDLTGNSRLVNKSAMSFSVWIKPAFDENETAWRYIYSDDNAFSVFYLGQKHQWRVMLTTDAGRYRIDTNINATDWSPDEWHKLSFSYDGVYANLYWDNVLQSTVQASGSTRNINNRVYIGKASVDTGYFSGLIDELKVFDTALPESELSSL